MDEKDTQHALAALDLIPKTPRQMVSLRMQKTFSHHFFYVETFLQCIIKFKFPDKAMWGHKWMQHLFKHHLMLHL